MKKPIFFLFIVLFCSQSWGMQTVQQTLPEQWFLTILEINKDLLNHRKEKKKIPFTIKSNHEEILNKILQQQHTIIDFAAPPIENISKETKKLYRELQGSTSLQFSLKNFNIPLTNWLLKKGANPKKTTSKNKMLPFQYPQIFVQKQKKTQWAEGVDNATIIKNLKEAYIDNNLYKSLVEKRKLSNFEQTINGVNLDKIFQVIELVVHRHPKIHNFPEKLNIIFNRIESEKATLSNSTRITALKLLKTLLEYKSKNWITIFYTNKLGRILKETNLKELSPNLHNLLILALQTNESKTFSQWQQTNKFNNIFPYRSVTSNLSYLHENKSVRDSNGNNILHATAQSNQLQLFKQYYHSPLAQVNNDGQHPLNLIPQNENFKKNLKKFTAITLTKHKTNELLQNTTVNPTFLYALKKHDQNFLKTFIQVLDEQHNKSLLEPIALEKLEFVSDPELFSITLSCVRYDEIWKKHFEVLEKENPNPKTTKLFLDSLSFLKEIKTRADSINFRIYSLEIITKILFNSTKTSDDTRKEFITIFHKLTKDLVDMMPKDRKDWKPSTRFDPLVISQNIVLIEKIDKNAASALLDILSVISANIPNLFLQSIKKYVQSLKTGRQDFDYSYRRQEKEYVPQKSFIQFLATYGLSYIIKHESPHISLACLYFCRQVMKEDKIDLKFLIIKTDIIKNTQKDKSLFHKAKAKEPIKSYLANGIFKIIKKEEPLATLILRSTHAMLTTQQLKILYKKANPEYLKKYIEEELKKRGETAQPSDYQAIQALQTKDKEQFKKHISAWLKEGNKIDGTVGNTSKTWLQLVLEKKNLLLAQWLIEEKNGTIDKNSLSLLFDMANYDIQYDNSKQATMAINLLSSVPKDTLNQQTSNGFTLLHTATEHKKIDIIDKLIEAGAKLLKNTIEQTPLDLAFTKYQKTFLSVQGDFNIKEQNEYKAIIEKLFKAARVENKNQTFSQLKTFEQFSLFLELQQKPLSEAPILTILESEDLKQKVALTRALGKKKQASYKKYLDQMLLSSVQQNDLESANLLIDAGADPSVKNNETSALHELAQQKELDTELFKKFITQSKQQETISEIVSKLENKEAIKHVVASQKAAIQDLRNIVKRGLEPTLSKEQWDDLLINAVLWWDEAIVKKCLENGADNSKALHLTMLDKTRLETMKFTDKQLLTKLRSILSKNRIEVLRQEDACINLINAITNKTLLTQALELAATKGTRKMAKSTIEKGTNARVIFNKLATVEKPTEESLKSIYAGITKNNRLEFLYNQLKNLEKAKNTKALEFVTKTFANQRKTFSNILNKAIQENHPAIVKNILKFVTLTPKTINEAFIEVNTKEIFSHFLKIKEDVITPDVIITHFEKLLTPDKKNVAIQLFNAVVENQKEQITINMVNNKEDSLLDIFIKKNVLISLDILKEFSTDTKQKAFQKSQTKQAFSLLLKDNSKTKLQTKYIIQSAATWFKNPTKKTEYTNLIKALREPQLLAKLLTIAISLEKPDIIKLLLSVGAEANSKIGERTALQSAVEKGNEKIITMLLTAKSTNASTKQDVFKTISTNNLYKLFLADKDIADEYLYQRLVANQAGLLENLSSERRSRLFALAVANNNAQLAELLKTKDQEISTDQISSALNNPKMIKALELTDKQLKESFEPENPTRAANIIRAVKDKAVLNKLLVLSVNANKPDLVLAAITRGASPDVALEVALDNPEMLKLLVEKGLAKDKLVEAFTTDNVEKAKNIVTTLKDDTQQSATLLKIAAKKNNAKLVNYILTTVTFDSKEPYETAFAQATEQSIFEALLAKHEFTNEFLIKQLKEREKQRETILNAVKAKKPKKLNPLLFAAIKQKDANLVSALLNAGASQNTTQDDKKPLESAVTTGDATVVEALLNTKLVNQETQEKVFNETEDPAIIKALMPTMTNDDLFITRFDALLSESKIEAAQALLDNIKNVNNTEEGTSLLDIAVKHSNVAMTKQLFENKKLERQKKIKAFKAIKKAEIYKLFIAKPETITPELVYAQLTPENETLIQALKELKKLDSYLVMAITSNNPSLAKALKDAGAELGDAIPAQTFATKEMIEALGFTQEQLLENFNEANAATILEATDNKNDYLEKALATGDANLIGAALSAGASKEIAIAHAVDNPDSIEILLAKGVTANEILAKATELSNTKVMAIAIKQEAEVSDEIIERCLESVDKLNVLNLDQAKLVTLFKDNLDDEEKSIVILQAETITDRKPFFAVAKNEAHFARLLESEDITQEVIYSRLAELLESDETKATGSTLLELVKEKHSISLLNTAAQKNNQELVKVLLDADVEPSEETINQIINKQWLAKLLIEKNKIDNAKALELIQSKLRDEDGKPVAPAALVNALTETKKLDGVFTLAAEQTNARVVEALLGYVSKDAKDKLFATATDANIIAALLKQKAIEPETAHATFKQWIKDDDKADQISFYIEAVKADPPKLTPLLSIAIEQNKPAVIAQLLEAGATPLEVYKEKSALQAALESKNQEVIKAVIASDKVEEGQVIENLKLIKDSETIKTIRDAEKLSDATILEQLNFDGPAIEKSLITQALDEEKSSSLFSQTIVNNQLKAARMLLAKASEEAIRKSFSASDNIEIMKLTLDTEKVDEGTIANRMNSLLDDNQDASQSLASELITRDIKLDKMRATLFEKVSNQKLESHLADFFNAEIKEKERKEEEERQRIEQERIRKKEEDRKLREEEEKKKQEKLERLRKEEAAKRKQEDQETQDKNLVFLRNAALVGAAKSKDLTELTERLNQSKPTEETIVKAFNQATSQEVFKALRTHKNSNIFISNNVIINRLTQLVNDGKIDIAKNLIASLENPDIDKLDGTTLLSVLAQNDTLRQEYFNQWYENKQIKFVESLIGKLSQEKIDKFFKQVANEEDSKTEFVELLASKASDKAKLEIFNTAKSEAVIQRTISSATPDQIAERFAVLIEATDFETAGKVLEAVKLDNISLDQKVRTRMLAAYPLENHKKEDDFWKFFGKERRAKARAEKLTKDAEKIKAELKKERKLRIKKREAEEKRELEAEEQRKLEEEHKKAEEAERQRLEEDRLKREKQKKQWEIIATRKTRWKEAETEREIIRLKEEEKQKKLAAQEEEVVEKSKRKQIKQQKLKGKKVISELTMLKQRKKTKATQPILEGEIPTNDPKKFELDVKLLKGREKIRLEEIAYAAKKMAEKQRKRIEVEKKKAEEALERIRLEEEKKQAFLEELRKAGVKSTEEHLKKWEKEQEQERIRKEREAKDKNLARMLKERPAGPKRRRPSTKTEKLKLEEDQRQIEAAAIKLKEEQEKEALEPVALLKDGLKKLKPALSELSNRLYDLTAN